MTIEPTHFFISDNEYELLGALIGGRRWIVGSSVGRAMKVNPPKAFGKNLRRKPVLQIWADSIIAKGVSLNRENQLYFIQRRVMSVEFAAFSVANMRVSETQISVFRMLIAIYGLGFDECVAERSMESVIKSGLDIGISISF